MPRARSEFKYTLNVLAVDMTEVLDSLTAAQQRGEVEEVFDKRSGAVVKLVTRTALTQFEAVAESAELRERLNC